MGFFKSLLKTVSPSAAHHMDKEQQKKNDALAARVYELEQNPVLGNGLGAGGYAGMGGMQPQLNQPPIQYPQLTQLPYFQQQGGLGQMPFMRNSAMMNTLGPLMQQNYGLGIVNPYAPGTPNGPPAQGQPTPPGAYQPQPFQPQPYQPPPPPGLGRMGVQPIYGRPV